MIGSNIGTQAADDNLSHYAGVAWDNTSEYPALSSSKLLSDLARIETLIVDQVSRGAKMSAFAQRAERLAKEEASQAVQFAQDAFKVQQEATVLLENINVFIECELSVDGRSAPAKALQGRLKAISARLSQAYKPFEMFLKLTSDDLISAYLAAPHTASQRFFLTQERKLRDQALSLPEEDLLVGLAVNGPTAWGVLYDSLAGSIKCHLELPDGIQTVGLAEAASLTQHHEESYRHSAFRAINSAWQEHEESCAAVLNALAGWRHEVYRRRSTKKPMHFLDAPLHQGHLSRETLEAMMTAVAEARSLGQKVLKLQAKALGKTKMAPWDLFAPCPDIGGGSWKKQTFTEAIQLIAAAFNSVHKDMGDFVTMMAQNSWIEGRVGPSKRPGAYCTEFVKSRSPRVYMTYSGGMREVKTLAHELGHAFHSWVMRDMPLPEVSYPMTLAETASIFGETVVNASLLSKAKAPADRLNFLWSAAREVEAFILNISARFEFEKRLYEKRLESTLSPQQLKSLMRESWESWYGDSLSEMDPMFWASKLHFSISDLSFYNFPYTFGYLFALGVYAQKDKLGDDFYPAYMALLRDTGRMSVEELAHKHLGADLRQLNFWRDSTAIAGRTVAEFEKIINETIK